MLNALLDGQTACISTTLLDGLVLARTGFNHSVNYRSVTVRQGRTGSCRGNPRCLSTDEPGWRYRSRSYAAGVHLILLIRAI